MAIGSGSHERLLAHRYKFSQPPQNMEYTANVLVFAGDTPVYRTHAADAARLLRDGLATRRCSGRKVKALDLIERAPLPNGAPSAHGNPHKYTFVESLGDPTTSHCHTLKRISRRSWPIFRSAVIDCLPAGERAEISQLFSTRKPGVRGA